MDPGTMDAGGVASGGRPGLSLLVPVQHLSGLSSLVVDTNSHRENTGQTSRRTGYGPPMARPRLGRAGQVRGKCKSGNFADFSEEEKMNGSKVQSLEEEPGEEEREQTEVEQDKEFVDLDPVMEHETATWSGAQHWWRKLVKTKSLRNLWAATRRRLQCLHLESWSARSGMSSVATCRR